MLKIDTFKKILEPPDCMRYTLVAVCRTALYYRHMPLQQVSTVHGASFGRCQGTAIFHSPVRIRLRLITP